MKVRQFKQLASLPLERQLATLSEGLALIAASVRQIISEVDRCNRERAFRAANILGSLGREEAGKFLILIDAARDPLQAQADAARQFGLASDHLAKLIYAQMADYSIASRSELYNAVQLFRPTLRLDGPNDYDWVFPNELIDERESAMYVDLAESEGELAWRWPHEDYAHMPYKSLELVAAIDEAGLSSVEGLHALRSAWRDFDHASDTNVGEWWQRTGAALRQVADSESAAGAGSFAVHEWPMPLTRIDVTRVDVKLREIEQIRKARYEQMLAAEYGWE